MQTTAILVVTNTVTAMPIATGKRSILLSFTVGGGFAVSLGATVGCSGEGEGEGVIFGEVVGELVEVGWGRLIG